MNEKYFHFTLPYVDMRIIKLARVSLISCANQLIWNLCHQKRGGRVRERAMQKHRERPDMVSVEIQTGSELPDLPTCTTPQSNNLQNSSTHNA
jgi:hypothetical protein